MATTTAAAAGTTTPDDWTLSAGASKVAAVAQPDDDATSYISSGATINTVQTFTCSPATIAVGDTVTQIDMDIRAMRGGSNNATFVVGYAFTPNGGGSQTGESGALTSTNAWGDFAYQHASLSVVWGSSLTIYCKNTQARDVRISTMDITITYTAAASGQPTRTMHQFRLRG